MLEEYPELLTVADIRKALGIGRNAAYKLISDNILQHKMIGEKIYIPKWCVEEFLRVVD